MSLDATIALVTKAEALQVLQISGSTEDAIVEELINRASDFASKYTGRALLQASYTEYYDGDGTDALMLLNYPVISVDSVNEDSTRAWAASSLISASDYVVEKGAGIIRLLYRSFLTAKSSIRVVYSAGYASGSIPHALRDAVLMIVQHHYKRIYQDQRIGLLSETIGDRTMAYSEEAIPKKAREILNAYRLKHSGDRGHV